MTTRTKIIANDLRSPRLAYVIRDTNTLTYYNVHPDDRMAIETILDIYGQHISVPFRKWYLTDILLFRPSFFFHGSTIAGAGIGSSSAYVIQPRAPTPG